MFYNSFIQRAIIFVLFLLKRLFEILYFPHIIFHFWKFFLQKKNSITKYISDEFSNHDILEYHFSTEHCSWTNWATNLYYHSFWRFFYRSFEWFSINNKKNKKWIDYSKIFIGVAFSLIRVVVTDLWTFYVTLHISFVNRHRDFSISL